MDQTACCARADLIGCCGFVNFALIAGVLMIRSIFAMALMMHASAAVAGTDFGIRTVTSESGAAPVRVAVGRHGALLQSPAQLGAPLSLGPSRGLDLNAAVRIGAQWGRVTSTRRSVAQNARVGGARNSYHLSGRAIDIARRAGVRHADIAAALRRAGFHLAESLDEGDHSHFAFGSGARPQSALRPLVVAAQEKSPWKVVFAPSR